MLNSIYKLPRPLLATILVGGGVLLIILKEPPYTFCDSQIEQFQKLQKGILYGNPADIHTEKSILTRKWILCRKENAPGACYEYFSYLRRLLRDLLVLSQECADLVYAKEEVQKALSSALALITALAWREEVLTGQLSKFNWLSRSDMYLFCDIKRKYLNNYGEQAYLKLEADILKLLPLQQEVSPKFLIKKTILSEPCIKYK